MIDLKVVVTKYPECLENSEKFRNYLKDLYPERADQVRIKVLADAMTCGIVDKIKAGKTGPVDVTRYRTQMEDTFGYSNRLVFECVVAWVRAFEPEVVPDLEVEEVKPSAAQRIIGKIHTHTFTDTVIAPTCIEHGYTLHRCKCGYERKDQFTPFGDHSFELVDLIEPTCTESGRKDYLCAACSAYKYEDLPPIAHQFGKWETVLNATCEKDGLQERKCSMCNKTESKTVHARGHQWGEWVDQIYASCIENGTRVRQCCLCGELEEETIKATGHDYSDWMPSRSKPGKYEHFCRKCGIVELLDFDSNYVKWNYKIVENRFLKYTGSEKNIIIPDCVNVIDVSAFAGCNKLISITIPNSVTRIREYAFSGCSNIASLTIPNSVTHIGFSAFSNCSSLRNITLSDNLTSIRKDAFSGFKSLTSIAIPHSVTSIGPCAFYGCSNLMSILIPESVKSIGHGAFLACKNLGEIYFGGTQNEWSNLIKDVNLFDNSKKVNIHFEKEF